MERCQFHKGVNAVWQLISTMNKYIDTHEPWALAKDDSRLPELETVLYNLIESLRLVSCLIFPIMPDTSRKMQQTLGMDLPANGFYTLDQAKAWGQMSTGTVTGKPDMLFPRIDVSKESAAPHPKGGKKGLKPALKDQITIEDFSKIDLRTATVIKAEKIEKSDRLLKLQVDLGAETRQVVAGIAKAYSPESLIGKQVILVANLKEAKLMGEVSQGMLLAVNHKKTLVLSGFDSEVAPGLPVK
jgi:methionyl-tRNA synthetase